MSKWIIDIQETDNEFWYEEEECDSREEAIQTGLEIAKEYELDSFRIGIKEECTIPTMYANSIIEEAQERLYDDVGEASDLYLENVTIEQTEDLENMINEVFNKWHKKYDLFPTCWQVLEDERIQVQDYIKEN